MLSYKQYVHKYSYIRPSSIFPTKLHLSSSYFKSICRPYMRTKLTFIDDVSRSFSSISAVLFFITEKLISFRTLMPASPLSRTRPMRTSRPRRRSSSGGKGNHYDHYDHYGHHNHHNRYNHYESNTSLVHNHQELMRPPGGQKVAEHASGARRPRMAFCRQEAGEKEKERKEKA